MPLYYHTGDIFTAETQVLVNPVNCVGGMGKGLALQFKQRYPEMFKVYRWQCQHDEISIGHPLLYQQSLPWILNFPTKTHWRLPSQLSYIEAGLVALLPLCDQHDIKSIAFPKLGVGEGGLSWEEVKPLMESYLSQLNAEVLLYE
jgi:O-acetyl-ADP-ribose deacetylase (regulator of RNase III)